MGIELDVLVGHPEHELLFVATQVAKAAGLKNPSASVAEYRKTGAGKVHALQLGTLLQDSCISAPLDGLGRSMRSSTAIATEPDVYQMLLRGNSPKSEPFRRWVTEEVLPTIRKTGKYNAGESTNPIAMGLMLP